MSNPPYIDRDAKTVAQQVINHEPHLALFAEDHGFGIIDRILDDARAHMQASGMLVIEHEPAHAARISSRATELGYKEAMTYKDHYGVLRYTQLTR